MTKHNHEHKHNHDENDIKLKKINKKLRPFELEIIEIGNIFSRNLYSSWIKILNKYNKKSFNDKVKVKFTKRDIKALKRDLKKDLLSKIPQLRDNLYDSYINNSDTYIKDVNIELGIGDGDVALNRKVSRQINSVISSRVETLTNGYADFEYSKFENDYISRLEEGDDIRYIVNDIHSDITGNEDVDSGTWDRIARTESSYINNSVIVDSANVINNEYNLGIKLIWDAISPCDLCAEFDGMEINTGEKFYEPDSDYNNGFPPYHPNCRCVIVYGEGEGGWLSDNDDESDYGEDF